jgi:hypothetical protein
MRVNSDKYYGAAAERYDAEREQSHRWAIENKAVADFVTSGPVLDVPLGTGRYVPVYRSKGLDFVGVDISRDMLDVAARTHGCVGWLASIFAMPFGDRSFATAVCTRMLDWLAPAEMEKAVAELRRVAETLIVTLRHGTEGISVNYTHSLARFYGAIDGLYIEARRTTEIGRHGHEEIFKLRPPVWRDVADQLAWHEGQCEAEIERLSGVAVSSQSATVSAEYWMAETIAKVVDRMALDNPDYITDEAPRFDGGPATILEANDRHFIIDGRRRMNRWQATPGRYPVLVIRP